MTKILLISLVLVAAFFAPVSNLPAQSALPRENINTFSQNPMKLKKLRDAVAALQARGFDRSTSWFTMAGIHDIFPNDPDLRRVPSAIQALFHQCHEREELFFLWHRAYVAAMERLMQDAINDPDFRLPYWNWYADPSLPEAFRNEFLDPQRTQKNPLFVRDRNRPPKSPVDVNRGDPIWAPEIITDYTNDNFAAFQGQLNENEHGNIHMFVGTRTNMGETHFAARDPIFYLHHANIDRLLMVWLKRSPGTHKAPTAFPGWESTLYRFPVPPGSTGNATPPVNKPSIADITLGSMEAMGYTYDNVDLPAVPTPTVPAAPQHLAVPAESPSGRPAANIERFAAIKPVAKALEVSGGGTVELTVQSSQREKIMALADMTPGEKPAERGLAIVFENVQVKEVPAGLASYRVFVNLPKEGASKEEFRDHFVGTLSLFSLQHGDQHGHATVTLPISPSTGAGAVKKSMAESGAAPSKINVSLVPVLAPGASAPKNPVLSIGEIRLEGKSPQ
jgi:tyrosinase